MMNRQSMPGVNIPGGPVEMEPSTMSSMVSGSAVTHLPSINQGASQGVQTQHTSQPSSTSQAMIASGDSVIPIVNIIPPSLRPTVPAAVNVSGLNNLSQARQVMSSTSLTGSSCMGFQAMGGIPRAMHIGLPAAQRVFSFGQSGNFTPMAGSGSLVGTAQISQNTALGSIASATSIGSGNSNHGVSQPFANIQGTISMGQYQPGMSQEIFSGTQIGHSGVGMNQNIMKEIGEPSISSVFWKGTLTIRGRGQPLPEIIAELEGYRGASASKTLAADWPPMMEIILLIPQADIRYWLYNGCKADFLVFRVLNQNTYLERVHKMNFGVAIRLHSQMLLLSFLDKANLFGLLLHPDCFSAQIPREQQQLQQHQQQVQQQLQQQLQLQQHMYQQWQRDEQQLQQQIQQQRQRQQQQQCSRQQDPQSQQQQQQQQLLQQPQLQQQQLQQQQQQLLQQPQLQQQQLQQQQQQLLQQPQLQQQQQQLLQQQQQQLQQQQQQQLQQQQQQQQQQLQQQQQQQLQQQQQQQQQQQLQQQQLQQQQQQSTQQWPQPSFDPQFFNPDYNLELDIANLPDSWKS